MCSITKNSEIETAVKSRARQEENIRASTALKSPRVSTPECINRTRMSPTNATRLDCFYWLNWILKGLEVTLT